MRPMLRAPKFWAEKVVSAVPMDSRSIQVRPVMRP